MKYLSLILVLALSANINSSPVKVNDGNKNIKPKLFEGDMAGVEFDANTKGLSRNPSRGYGKWPGGVVPYIIDADTYDELQLSKIADGMKWIEDSTRINGRDCIRFVPRTNENTYLRIHNSDGCWSYVGKQNAAGAQLLSLQKPSRPGGGHCLHDYIVSHELIHALGFYHEQSRPDRDDYIQVNWENIEPEDAYNFDKYTTNVDTLGFPYDLYSIMHYDWDDFSINGQATIESKVPGVDLKEINHNYLTDIDIGELRKYYGCS